MSQADVPCAGRYLGAGDGDHRRRGSAGGGCRLAGRLAMVGGLPDPGMRKRWTYAQLLAQAEPAARALAARFAPGERVAVWAPNLPEWAIVEYAAALAGLVLVMVMVNLAYRPAELAYVLNQSDAAGIFLVPEFRSPMAEFLAEVRPKVPSLREVVYFTGWDDFLAAAPEDAVLPEVGRGDIAQIQHTSGTTGFPTCGAAFPAWRRAILVGNIGLSPHGGGRREHL